MFSNSACSPTKRAPAFPNPPAGAADGVVRLMRLLQELMADSRSQSRTKRTLSMGGHSLILYIQINLENGICFDFFSGPECTCHQVSFSCVLFFRIFIRLVECYAQLLGWLLLGFVPYSHMVRRLVVATCQYHIGFQEHANSVGNQYIEEEISFEKNVILLITTRNLILR